MPENTYLYNIANDTVNGKIDGSRLTADINASEIKTVLSRIETDGNQLEIIFVAVLSNASQTVLTDLVSLHIGTPLPIVDDHIMLYSPDGTRWKVTVDDDGFVSAEAI